MGKGGDSKRKKTGASGVDLLKLDQAADIHTEAELAASDFVVIDRAYAPDGRDAKSGLIRLENILMPDKAYENGEDPGLWRVDHPYTDPSLRAMAASGANVPKETRLGGLTLKGADLLRPGDEGPDAAVPQGFWGYLPSVDYNPQTGTGRIASMLFAPETQPNGDVVGAQAHFDTVNRRASCSCNNYNDLRVCPHIAIMFLGYCAHVGKDQKGPSASIGQSLRQRWHVWLNTARGQQTEGAMLMKLVDAFHAYLEANPTLTFTTDSKELDAEISGLANAIKVDRERREGGGVETEEGEFRIPAIDEQFAGITTSAEYDANDRTFIPPYPRDLVLTRNFDRAIFAVANRVRERTAYSFGFYGPKGTGKDTCARAIATALRRPVFTFDCDAATNFSWALGGTDLVENVDEREIVKDGEVKKISTKVGGSHLEVTLGGLGEALMKGYVVIIDEIIAADPRMRTALHMAMQDRVFVIKDPKAGTRRFPVHKDTVIICTWNPATDGQQAQMPGEALTDRLMTVSFDPEPAEEVSKKLAKYLNERYVGDAPVAFETDDCMPIGKLIQVTLPKFARERLLKRTPSYRTATKLVDQLAFIGLAGKKVSDVADYAIDPLVYLVDQPDGRPEVKQTGVDQLIKEFTGGDDWDNSPLMRKFAQIREHRKKALAQKPAA